MMKALVSLILTIVVIVIYTGFLATANQTAIGAQAMQILNIMPVFIALAGLGICVALVVNAFRNTGGKGGGGL
jgi:hypothetical protein